MPDKPYTGLTAAIYVNSTLLGYMNSVDLSLEKDTIEIVSFGDQYKEKLPAIKNWTASSEGTVAFVNGGSQHALYMAYESGEEVTLKIKLDGDVYFTGTALISSLSISGSPEEALSLSVEFEGTGAITFNIPETVLITIRNDAGGVTDPTGVVRVTKGGTLAITCHPVTGRVASKYYLDNDVQGVAITSNSFSLSSAQTNANHTLRVTYTTA